MRTRYAPPAVQEALAAAQARGPVPASLDGHERRQQARRERKAADFAVQQARQLAMSLFHSTPVEARPYSSGLVLGPRETLWAETQARCSWDQSPYARRDPARLPLTCWVVTNMRLSGRLSTGRTVDLPWAQMTHCRVDISRGKEWLALDGWGTADVWHGTGIAPLAVAAVCKAHGALVCCQSATAYRLWREIVEVATASWKAPNRCSGATKYPELHALPTG